MSDEPRPRPDDETVSEEEREARRAHTADRAASRDEERAADNSRKAFSGDAERVAENEKSMAERGAHVKGEGEIT